MIVRAPNDTLMIMKKNANPVILVSYLLIFACESCETDTYCVCSGDYYEDNLVSPEECVLAADCSNDYVGVP